VRQREEVIKRGKKGGSQQEGRGATKGISRKIQRLCGNGEKVKLNVDRRRKGLPVSGESS